MPTAPQTTLLLRRFRNGDSSAADQLFSRVYDELRSLAGRLMRHERDGHTLEPTALVNEAYLRLVDHSDADIADRTHFFAIAATHMRRILVDHARARKADKRGGDWRRTTLDAVLDRCQQQCIDIVDLDDALTRLAVLDERQARVVELRLFSGLGVEETAVVLGVSERTVKDDFHFAKAWLRLQLDE